MKTFIAATLVGASAIGVELEGPPGGSEQVWNGDISGFKHGDYSSIPEIAVAKQKATVHASDEIPELGSGMSFGKFGKGTSYGLYEEAFPSFGGFGGFPGLNRFGKDRLYGGKGGQKVISGGIEELGEMSGIKTLDEQDQIDGQLKAISALKGMPDMEGVDGGLPELNETKQTKPITKYRSVGEYGGYAGIGPKYGARANAAYGLQSNPVSGYGRTAAPSYGSVTPYGRKGVAYNKVGRRGGFRGGQGRFARPGYGGRRGASYGARPVSKGFRAPPQGYRGRNTVGTVGKLIKSEKLVLPSKKLPLKPKEIRQPSKHSLGYSKPPKVYGRQRQPGYGKYPALPPSGKSPAPVRERKPHYPSADKPKGPYGKPSGPSYGRRGVALRRSSGPYRKTSSPYRKAPTSRYGRRSAGRRY